MKDPTHPWGGEFGSRDTPLDPNPDGPVLGPGVEGESSMMVGPLYAIRRWRADLEIGVAPNLVLRFHWSLVFHDDQDPGALHLWGKQGRNSLGVSPSNTSRSGPHVTRECDFLCDVFQKTSHTTLKARESCFLSVVSLS